MRGQLELRDITLRAGGAAARYPLHKRFAADESGLESAAAMGLISDILGPRNWLAADAAVTPLSASDSFGGHEDMDIFARIFASVAEHRRAAILPTRPVVRELGMPVLICTVGELREPLGLRHAVDAGGTLARLAASGSASTGQITFFKLTP